MKTRARFTTLLVLAAILFTVGVYLRLEAHALCTRRVHLQGTPGAEPNASYTDESHFDALVEIARVFLCLAAVMTGTVAAAWIFLPDFRLPEYTDLMKNWPPGPGKFPDDPRFPS